MLQVLLDQKKTQKMQTASKQNGGDSGEEAIIIKHHNIESVKSKFNATPKMENEFKAKSYPLFECSNRFEILEDEEVELVENKENDKLVKEKDLQKERCVKRCLKGEKNSKSEKCKIKKYQSKEILTVLPLDFLKFSDAKVA